MSLLLDALKRAEQEKLARQPGAAAPTPRAAPPPARESSLELQPLAAAGAAAPAQPSTRAEPAAGAQAAQNVFQAKGAAPAEPERRSRAILWITVAAVAVVAIAAAGYVWHTVKSLTPQYASAPRPRAAPTPPPASSAPLPPTSAMGSIVPVPATAGAGQSTSPGGTPVPASPPAPALPAAPAQAQPSAEPTQESPAERLARAALEAPAAPPLQMERTAPPAARVPADIATGYEALRKGDAASARRAYQAAIASDPTNVDAHLGLATLAAREANRAVAAEHYRRALQFDPRNATAAAGLAALADFSRPDALEAQLRADIDRMPASPALQYTLGNLYAAQGRWREAQSAFYEAHRLDPGSAEIAHNLAVSLDRLGQRRLAAGFYRRALEAAAGRATPLDTAAVARRLAEIE